MLFFVGWRKVIVCCEGYEPRKLRKRPLLSFNSSSSLADIIPFFYNNNPNILNVSFTKNTFTTKTKAIKYAWYVTTIIETCERVTCEKLSQKVIKRTSRTYHTQSFISENLIVKTQKYILFLLVQVLQT